MKVSNKSKEFVSIGYKSDVMNIAVCSVLMIGLGIASFCCASNIIWHSDYLTAVKVISIVSVLAGITVLIWGLINANERRLKLRRFIEEFSFSVLPAAETAVLNFPDPIVVIDEDGVIRWFNTEFSELCGKNELLGVCIDEFFPAIHYGEFLDENKRVMPFSYNGRDFMVMGAGTPFENSEGEIKFIGISFADVSEITHLRNEIDEKQSVVCSVVIDNYEQVLKETPSVNHGVLLGDVEHCINLWVDKGDGFVRKYDRDKFVVIFENSKFEKLLAEKFSLLNDVKEISHENKIPVTLSIGVGADAESLRENDRLSSSALEMALGRGGDQAVVKSDEGYSFYGAKSLGVESTAKVKARVVAKSLCSLIDKASNVIIMGHKGSDFDSFGASAGLFRSVLSRGKNVYIALDRNHNNVTSILKEVLIHSEYNERIVSYDRALSLVNQNTLLVVVDTHRASMVEYPELLSKIDNIVLIDHHRRAEDFMENVTLLYHESYASSTSEMVTEVLQYIDDENGLSLIEAEALYCGIYLDTKGFTFKTGARTFEAAAYLRKMGVDPVRVHKLFRTDISMFIQKSRIINNTKIYQDNIAIAICEETSRNIQLVVAKSADDLLDINGIEASFVLAETGNKTIISGRSLGSINVQVILEKLGGGGHSTVAGAQLENSGLTIAELKLRKAIDEVLFD